MNRWSGESPMLAHRAASEGPRWTRAIRGLIRITYQVRQNERVWGWINHCQTINVGRGKSVGSPSACLSP